MYSQARQINIQPKDRYTSLTLTLTGDGDGDGEEILHFLPTETAVANQTFFQFIANRSSLSSN